MEKKLEDIVDVQSFCHFAEKEAIRLFKKHNGDLKSIKEEVFSLTISSELKEEILWAAKWIS